MVEPDALAALAQLGTAGLIGWMWLTERRAASERDLQIREAHQSLLQDRTQLDILVRALESNTRAITALEAGQRELIRIIDGPRPATPRPNSPTAPSPSVTVSGFVPPHAVH